MSNEVKRILYCMPETAGDVLISTGVISALAKKFPQAKIYFATQEQFFPILEGNPNIAKVIPYDDSMLNYRRFETWGPQKNPFDIVYCPFIVTQRIPHWIHGGHGEFLGTVYAHLCDVEFDEMHIAIDNNIADFNLPKKYITVHSQTRQDPKDYDNFQKVVDCIKDIGIVQIGGEKDKPLNGVTVDLRGKTTPGQLAAVLFNAEMHLGHDSFPMHVASHVGVKSVIMFGGTYAKQGLNPRREGLVRAIETQDRGFCVTSCHLIDCEAKKAGFDKCINNISFRTVLEKVRECIGEQHVEMPPRPKLSAYMIIRDGIKYGFPYEECIRSAMAIVDEMVVVDGGSTDGTYEHLATIAADYVEQDDNKEAITHLRILKHEWDMNKPTLFGDEKTYARQKCTGEWLIQLDADEIISEPYPGAIYDLIERNDGSHVLDLPCINFYGDTETIRIEDNCWKWRISKNDPNVIHGVFGKARQLDPATLQITMDKKQSDGCEYIKTDSLEIAPHRPVFNPVFLMMHEGKKQGKVPDDQYLRMIKEVISKSPVVFHYSWLDLNRKKEGGEFWDKTFHGQKGKTHNTTQDIEKRVAEKKDILVKVDFDHPLKEKK